MNELDGKADTNHTHTTSQINNLRTYIESIIDDYGGGSGGTKTYSTTLTVNVATHGVGDVLWSINIGSGVESITGQFKNGRSTILYSNGTWLKQTQFFSIRNTGSAIDSVDCYLRYNYSGSTFTVTIDSTDGPGWGYSSLSNSAALTIIVAR